MKKVLILALSIFFSSFIIAQVSRDYITKIEKVDKAKLDDLIKNRNGKALLLNIWATWCVPCREEFPDLVKIQNEFNDVQVIGISADYPDETESKIIPFLKKQKPNFHNYVNAFKPDTELIDFLNKSWNGALPASFLYDKNGKLLIFMDGKRTYNQFKEELKKL